MGKQLGFQISDGKENLSSAEALRKVIQKETNPPPIAKVQTQKLSNAKDELVLALHNIFDPIVSRIRGQCQFIETIQAFAFKKSEKINKRMHHKQNFDLILLQPEVGQRQFELFEGKFSLKDADIFELFLEDIKTMLQHRGIRIASVHLEKDQRFYLLSNLSIQCYFSNGLSDEIPNFEIFSLDDKKQRDWIKEVKGLIKAYPIPDHLVLPSLSFKTRDNFSQRILFFEEIRRSCDSTTFETFIGVMNNTQTSVMEKYFAGLPFVWERLKYPVESFEFKSLRNKHVLTKELKNKLPKMISNRTLKDITLDLKFQDEDYIESCWIILLSKLCMIPLIQQLSINFSGTQFQNDKIKYLARLLVSSPTLTQFTLKISDTRLTDADLKILAVSLGTLFFLTTLDFDFSYNNNLYNNGVAYFLENSFVSPHISKIGLNLSRCAMIDQGIISNINSMLESHVSLSWFKLILRDYDWFTYEICTALSSSISSLQSLSKLELSFNNSSLTKEGVIILSDIFLQHQNLTKISLDLGNLSLQEDECHSIGECLPYLQMLSELELKFAESSRIGNKSAEAIGKGLRYCVSLRIVYVDFA
eukprot:TRINITY_DN4431_c0_g1_i3.p1 TRINITY_DN4431_c0_g1~~TRINITY_DN4431_c0_g1_i3.p1  ORF type:complete len:588 (+),score=63.37 TRINITY_DN4431_c0_g1_i3:119-1882(+)